MENPTSSAMWRTVLIVCATLVALSLASASSDAARITTGFKGVWVATGSSSGKTVLRLLGAGKRYHGTYTLVRRAAGKTKKKVLRVTARTGAADGASQLTLTFTKTKRSTLCGLVGVRLYCQLGTSGPTVFVRH